MHPRNRNDDGKRINFLFFLFLAILLTACRPEPHVIKIGFVAPFEGRHRAVGYDAIYAARLAIREQNAAGGIGPYRIGLVAIDDSGNKMLAEDVARSMVVDEDVVAVVGHWLIGTSTTGAAIYSPAGLPLVIVGAEPFLPYPASALPGEFLEAYAHVTPFDEEAGDYSGPTYDAFQLLFAAMEEAVQKGPITAETLHDALARTSVEGLTGRVYLP